MRIVQVITGLNPAGAERIVSDLGRGLKTRGNEVQVVSLMPVDPDSPIPLELAAAGIPVHSMNLFKTAPWRVFRLPEILKALRPQVVHAHMFHANLASRIGKRNAAYKIVNTAHSVEPRRRKRWLLFLDRLTRNRCHVYTAVSREAQAFLASRVGLPRERVPVIHNGIQPPRRIGDTEVRALRKSWGLEDHDLVLGAVGRLVHEKGFDLLLRLLPRIVPPRIRIGLVILGEGPERRALERLAPSIAGRPTVAMPGHRPDAASCMAAFDVLAIPSRHEGFGLVLAEGMAHGIPILASRNDTLLEVGEGYDRVRYVDFSDATIPEIRSGIQDLLEMTSPGTPFLPFSTERMVAEYLELYEALLIST